MTNKAASCSPGVQGNLTTIRQKEAHRKQAPFFLFQEVVNPTLHMPSSFTWVLESRLCIKFSSPCNLPYPLSFGNFLTSCLAADKDRNLLWDHTPVLNVASILKLFDWRIITHCLPAAPSFPFLSPPNWNPIPLKNLSKLEEITEDSHLSVKLDRIQLTVGCGICSQNLRVSVLYHWAPQLMAFGTCCQKWMELSGIHLILSRTKLQFKSINHFISHSGFLHVIIKI